MPDGSATATREYVEVKGKIVCDEPIRGELSDKMAAIVETEVLRVYERREERRDPQGNVRTEWRKGEETVSSNRRESPFWIDDGTGRLRVKTTTKGVDLEKVVERFESASSVESGFGGHLTLSVGRFQLSVAGGGYDGASSRTLGYKFIERALPAGKNVYAIGEAAHIEDDGLVLRAPTDEDKKKPFMVSLRTEEEIVRSSEKSALVLRIVGGVLAAGGAALIVFGIIRK
ncbi:MAG: E3 ubiquitin ligase family protein [Myxococcota bacterium]